jgi:hypothetical protein
VQRALARAPKGASVSHFTYWYTTQPPAFEAVIQVAAR